jgi:hypothetical protein
VGSVIKLQEYETETPYTEFFVRNRSFDINSVAYIYFVTSGNE